MNDAQLFPDSGKHQNLEIGKQSGNTAAAESQNPRSGHKNTVSQESGNSRETVPGVFPVSSPPIGGKREPEPDLDELTDILGDITLTETADVWTITFPTRSAYLRAQLRPRNLLRVGQLLPGKPIRLNHQEAR